jgi:chromosome segregation ATPase
METDTIKEKYIRSEEALSRLRDDISQLINARIQDLQGTKEYLDTLVKEKEAVDAQLVEQKAKIASFKDNIEISKTSITTEKQSNAEHIEDIQQKDVDLRELEREQESVILTTEAIEKKIQKIRLEIDNRKIGISDYQKKIQTLEQQLVEEAEKKEQERGELIKTIQEIQNENKIQSFLLEESAEDLPEVEILAELMKQERVTTEQLKQSLDGRISPVIVTRTVGRMIEKNLIVLNDRNDTLTPS